MTSLYIVRVRGWFIRSQGHVPGVYTKYSPNKTMYTNKDVTSNSYQAWFLIVSNGLLL
jgi:hypothetical protein